VQEVFVVVVVSFLILTLRESKKFSKQMQLEIEKKRKKQKDADLEAIKKWRKDRKKSGGMNLHRIGFLCCRFC
jgi:hypothetical protein